MRLLLCGIATIALGGCSWMGAGFGSNGHHGANYYKTDTGSYGAGAFKSAHSVNSIPTYSTPDAHAYNTHAASSRYSTYNQAHKAASYKKPQRTHAHNGFGPCCNTSTWGLEAAVGPEYFVDGDILTGKTHSLPGITANKVGLDDGFDNGLRYELGASKTLNPNRKLTVMAHYAQADGNDITLGEIAGDAVTGRLSDYERYGIEAGLRQYFKPSRAPIVKAIRPYVEGRLGAAHYDDVRLTNAERAGASYNGGTVGLYESGWVPTAAGLVGVEAPIFKRATLALESGLRYSGNLEKDTTDLGAGAPFGGTNSGGDQWTVPVMLRGRYRF